MVESKESIEVELKSILSEIRDLKTLYQHNQYEDYRIRAQVFLKEHRDFIRRSANTLNPTLTIVLCLNGLQIINDNLPQYDEDLHRSDENLLIEVMERFHPVDSRQAKRHEFQKHTCNSNIYKRRAFAEAKDKKLALAATLMGEAVRSGRQAMEALPKNKSSGAFRHLQYLVFHHSILKMRIYEIKGDNVNAMTSWEEAQRVVEDSHRPMRLFPAQVCVWDKSDFMAYPHLIEAQAAWFQSDYPKAVKEYDSWMASVSKHKKRWRFRNLKVRRHLSMVITCFVKKCDGCDRCRQSADYLQQLAQDGNLGAAGRHLASRGIMLQALKQTRLFVSEVLDAEVADLKSYIPIESYYHEEILKIPEDHFLPYLPNYFTSLSTEVKRIARIEDFDSVWLREFVLHRLREFIQINCEYEVERNAALTNIQPPDISEVSLTDMSEILVKARSSRKSSKDEGVSAWESVTRILARTEDSPGSEDILDAYESVLEKVSGLFPTVIRFVERRERDNDYSALVETLLGDEFIIESQFPLSGDYAYLPPRFKYNPVDMKLLQKDRSKIIQSTRAVQGIYALQSVPIWEGAWSELMLKHFESFSLDFKREHPKKLAKHLAAFANTEGGWLVFGIFDPILDLSEGPVLGLKPREATNIINSVGIAGVKMLAPPILPTTCFRAYPNWKLVILYKILQSPVAPHKVKDLIYIREGARSDSISEDEWNDLVLSKNEGSQAKE